MGRGHRNDEKCKAQQRCRIWKILWAEYRKSTLRCLPRSVSHNYHQSCASKQISKQTNQQQCQRPVNSDEHVWRPGEGLEVVILRGICVGFCCWCCCFDVQTVEHGSCLWHCQNVWTTICPMPPSIHRHLTSCAVCFCLCLWSNWSRILLWTTSKKFVSTACVSRLLKLFTAYPSPPPPPPSAPSTSEFRVFNQVGDEQDVIVRIFLGQLVLYRSIIDDRRGEKSSIFIFQSKSLQRVKKH